MRIPYDNELDINSFEKMLSMRRLTNSYKLYWLYAILDFVNKGKVSISFDNILIKMIALAWHSAITYKLSLGAQDQLSELIIDINDNYKVNDNISHTGLANLIAEVIEKNDKIYAAASDLFKYVPYRLISSFYSEKLRGIKDYKKNKMIEDLADDKKAIYRFKEDRIIINDNWFKYMESNMLIISGWLKLKLIKYLQNRNPNVPAIPFKLDLESSRNLRTARSYWGKIIEINDFRGIYTGELLDESNFDVDHFIPWSFVLHNKIWNLIPSINSINKTKNNKLPDLNIYLNKFCDQQYNAIKIAIDHKFSEKLLRKIQEDYLEIDLHIDLSKGFKRNHFNKSIKNTIKPLHQIASNQGFDKWVN